MGLHSGSLRADFMLAYSLENLNCLSELQLRDARNNLCRLLATSRGDTQRQIQQSTGSTISGYSKSSWKGHNKHSEGGRFFPFDKSNRSSLGASCSGSHGHGNFSLGQKRKPPPREVH
jgi:hypothetical protein